MAVLGIRKNSWQGLSDRNKTIVRSLGILLSLGTPAEYKTPLNVRWFVFSDWRFKAEAIAYFGCVIANLSDIPSGYKIPQIKDDDGNDLGLDRSQLRSDVVAWCSNPARTNPYVDPADITHADGGNVWQDILDAQGTPKAVRMADSIPASWSAVSADA